MISKKYYIHIPFIFLLALTWLLFQQGISNSFILDDVPNLRGLSNLQDFPSFDQILAFIFHNTHVNSGRPVSFLSFFFQVSDWPNPAPFKQINIYLHLFNGILVYWFIQLLISHSLKKSIPLLSIGITALWLISPIQVDTVQYVVQRMTMLASTFMLLGLIAYMYARTRLSEISKAILLLYIVFGSCLVLAVFSKENGLLLTTLIVLLEYSLFKKMTRPRFYKVWFSIAIILPIFLFIALLIYRSENTIFYTYRGFNAIERLLTQQGIILHYISSVIAPTTSKLTLFYDDYPISSALFSPPITFFYLLINLGLIVIGIKSLRKWPLFGIGILFFYINHLMESTFLPLELYFEHRNYLAILGISISIFSSVYYLQQFIHKKSIAILIYAVPLVLVVTSILVNIQQNIIWKNPLYQAQQWYQKHPLSHRAHGHYGMQLNKSGMYNDAIKFYESTSDLFPNDPTKSLLWLEISCNPKAKPAPDKRKLLHIVQHGAHYKETIAILLDFIQLFEADKCPGVSIEYFLKIVKSVMNNSKYKGKAESINLLIIEYRAYQLLSNYRQASKALEKVLLTKKRADILSALTEKYILLNQIDDAQKMIIVLKSFCSENPIKCAYSKKNINLLEKMILHNKARTPIQQHQRK